MINATQLRSFLTGVNRLLRYVTSTEYLMATEQIPVTALIVSGPQTPPGLWRMENTRLTYEVLNLFFFSRKFTWKKVDCRRVELCQGTENRLVLHADMQC